MTVINHKNISGITSITTPAGSDNLFTVHTNDTTERFRIDASGHQNISGIITASNFKTGTTNVHNVGVEVAGINVLGADTPIGTGATIYNSGAAVFTGVVTATSFKGSITDATGYTTINNNANYRVISGDANANELNAESNLTFNGSILGVTGDIAVSTANRLYFGNSDVAFIKGEHGGSGYLALGANTEHVRITRAGKVGIGTDVPTYKLHVDSGDAAIGLWKSRRSSGSYIEYAVGANGAALGYIGAGGQILTGGADSGDFAIRSQGDLCFSSGGAAERIRINSSGKLGIGFKFNYTMNSSSTDLVIGDGGSGRGLTIWTAAGADNQTISFQTNETLNRAEGEISYGPTNTSTTADRNAMMFRVNSGERLRIDSSGHMSLGGGATPSSTNGGIGLKYGIKSAANNIIIGETTSSSHNGLILESRLTGRSGNARTSQINIGQDGTGGHIIFSTAAGSADVTQRLKITRDGCVYASNFGIGTDDRWKIRANTSNNELAFEYSTSSTLADTNIKAFFRDGGSFCIKSDPLAAGGTMGDRGLIFQAASAPTNGQVIQGITFCPHATAIGRARAGITALANSAGGSHPQSGADLSFMTRYSADGHDLDVTTDQRLRIDINGDFIFNTPTLSGMALWNMTGNDQRARYQFWQKTGTHRGAAFHEDRGDANGMDIIISKSRGGAGAGAVNAGDWIGRLMFAGADGTRCVNAGYVGMLANTGSTIASDRIPSKMVFGTHLDSASGLGTRMTLTHQGRLGIGIDPPEAVLHPRANPDHGTDTAFQVGTGNRYFKLNELGGQDNFGQCYVSFYDNSLREILTLENSYAGAANMGMAIVFRGHGGGQTGSIRAYNPSVNTTSGSVLHLNPENNNSGFKISSGETRVVGGVFHVSNFQIRDGGWSGTWDTGISVNQGNAGAAMIVIACKNWNAGDSTQSGMYFVRFPYDGNNNPSVWHIGGNNSWTIDRNTSNHTLQINGGSGNQRASFIWTT